MNDYSTNTFISSSGIELADGIVQWFHYDCVPSTMDLAVSLVKKGVDPWTVVSAESQSNGRGTKGRTWISGQGQGLWCSIILPPPVDPSDMAPVTMLAAEALVQTLKQWAESGITIKHPNDVLLNNRKIAGILCESVIAKSIVTSLILGMGVNLLQSRDHFMTEGLTEATSLTCETGKNIDIQSFLRDYLRIFKPRYEKTILN